MAKEYEVETWRQIVIEAIKQHGGAHKRISLEAGLGPTFVRDLIQRGQEPGVDKLRKLCVYLGLDFAGLFSKEPKSSEDIAYEVQKTALSREFIKASSAHPRVQKLIIEGMRGTLKIMSADQVKSVHKPEPKKLPQKANAKKAVSGKV